MSHTQLIPDIYEVEQTAQHSGSYSDGIYVGDIKGIARSSVISGIVDGPRKRIAHHSTGSNLLLMVSQSYDEYFNSPDFLGFSIPYSLFSAHSNRRICGNNFRYNSSISQNELFYDSLPPDPLAIYKLNGGKMIFSNLEDYFYVDNPGSGSATDGPNSDLFLFASLGFKFVLGHGDCRATASNNSSQISDNTWLSTFPYQRTYSGINRISSRLFVADTVTCGQAMSMSAGSPVIVKYFTSNPIGIEKTAHNVSIEFLSLSSSNGALTPTRFHNTAVEYMGSVRTGLVFSGGYIEPLTFVERFIDYGIDFTNQTGYPFLKTFFGFGDGFRGAPTFDTTFNTHSGSSFYYRSASPVIRGCKYGMLNPFPISTKVIYRKSRYGHFRDMLEQRPFTKFYDSIGINSDGSTGGRVGAAVAPVAVKFISGSAAYFTSSNPSLDTAETGFYNFEGTVGRPFFD